MSDIELLVARKEMLAARASVQRLQAAVQVDAIRESLRWPRPLVAAATSPRGLAVAGAAVILILARSRLATAARWAGTAVALLRLWKSR